MPASNFAMMLEVFNVAKSEYALAVIFG
jgi:hypothetical protein